MRRPVQSLILALMLSSALIAAGCNAGKKASDKPDTPQTPPAGQTDPATTPAPGADTPAPSVPPVNSLGELVSVAPASTVEHVTLDSTTPVDRTGLFFLNTKTGNIDGWIIKAGQDQAPGYGVSPDNRWVVASAQKDQQRTTYLADRKSGKAYQWEAQKGRLVAAGGAHLLFEAGGRFWLAGEDPTQGKALAIRPSAGQSGYQQAMAPLPGDQSPTYIPSQALFSPDSATLFLVNGRELFLVRPDSGEARKLAELPAQESGSDLLSLGFEPLRPNAGLALTARYSLQRPGSPFYTRMVRFGWDGQKLSDVVMPHDGGLSTGGRFVWWKESLGGLAPAVVVGDSASLQPTFRLDAASFATGWLADSSGMVVRTSKGYQVLRNDGTLLDVTAFAGTHMLNQPVPSPDKEDWFAIGPTTVLKADGSKVAAAIAYSAGKWLGDMRLAPWGYTSEELRFGLHNWGGKGGSGEPYILPARLERPPFDQAPSLVVKLPANDCLNLRTSFSKTAPSVTCLPAGTRLHKAGSPGRINKGWLESWGNPVGIDMGNEYWLYVRTDAGQRGYVAMSGEYLDWAPVDPSAQPPDRMLEQIADEKANMAWWLSAALGEADCGNSCSDPSFDTILAAFYNRDKTDGGLVAALRADATYKAARHEAALKPLEQASALIVKTWTDLGQPGLEPSAAWKQAVNQARSLLKQ